MRIQVCADAAVACAEAAAIVIGAVRAKPDAVLGLATGRSPIGVYARMRQAYAAGEVSFRRATAVNLDEYAGLKADDPSSFAAFMRRELYAGVDFREAGIHIPDGMAADLAAECARYDGVLNAVGTRDVQVLGIGANGHIGFNEPGEKLSAGTHVVRLTEETRAANAADFPSLGEVPTHAVTMGVGDILKARTIVLVAFGPAKAEAIRSALRGPVATGCPGSLLQLHPDVRVFLDPEAARQLE